LSVGLVEGKIDEAGTSYEPSTQRKRKTHQMLYGDHVGYSPSSQFLGLTLFASTADRIN
jgi:hypothetical protein